MITDYQKELKFNINYEQLSRVMLDAGCKSDKPGYFENITFNKAVIIPDLGKEYNVYPLHYNQCRIFVIQTGLKTGTQFDDLCLYVSNSKYIDKKPYKKNVTNKKIQLKSTKKSRQDDES
jgi:hypothetical protein